MRSAPPERETFRLDPPGPMGLIGGPTRLAGNGGKLFGELVGNQVSIWVQHDNGERVLTMQPGEYSARLAPLELLNERGKVVARDDQTIYVVGGFLPDSDPRAVGRVFFASRVLREPITPQLDASDGTFAPIVTFQLKNVTALASHGWAQELSWIQVGDLLDQATVRVALTLDGVSFQRRS